MVLTITTETDTAQMKGRPIERMYFTYECLPFKKYISRSCMGIWNLYALHFSDKSRPAWGAVRLPPPPSRPRGSPDELATRLTELFFFFIRTAKLFSLSHIEFANVEYVKLYLERM